MKRKTILMVLCEESKQPHNALLLSPYSSSLGIAIFNQFGGNNFKVFPLLFPAWSVRPIIKIHCVCYLILLGILHAVPKIVGMSSMAVSFLVNCCYFLEIIHFYQLNEQSPLA